LRGVQAVLNERGIGFVVVSGDMIDGTIVVRLLERRDPSAVADRRLHGDLPTVDEFAGGIVAATREIRLYVRRSTSVAATTPGQSVVRQTDKGHRELTW
jgi:hypothetical protein